MWLSGQSIGVSIQQSWVQVPALIGPFEFESTLKFKWTNQSWEWNHVASGHCRMPHHKGLRKAEEVNFKANFSFFTSLSAAEAHIFGLKFIGLYGTVIFIAIWDFSRWGESDLWSGVWSAMYGVVCLSILLEGGVTVSNNFTKQRQNGFKSAQETSPRHIWGRKTLFQMRYLFTQLFYNRWFSHTILYIHKLSHTPRISSLGSLCKANKTHKATQKKCLHEVHFNVPRDWFLTNSQHQKCYYEGSKKICGCRGLLGRVIRLRKTRAKNEKEIENLGYVFHGTWSTTLRQ